MISFLQTDWWAALKGEFGWQTARYNSWHVFIRDFPFFRFAYLPHAFCGTFYEQDPATALDRAVEALRAIIQTIPNLSLLRWDVPWDNTTFSAAGARTLGLRVAPMNVQPPNTVLIDLLPDTETLLAAMKPKTRYNIRLAKRRGVQVERCGVESISIWYKLYQQTAARDVITIHDESYYKRVFTLAQEMQEAKKEVPTVRLYLAFHEGDAIGGIVVVSWQGVGTYLYGASSSYKRNLMGNYLLQWEAMCDMKANGNHVYDLFGIPPSASQAHPMYGLYRFKTGFGGRIVNRAGCWDLPYKLLLSNIFCTLEHTRMWYYNRVRKFFAGKRV